MQIETRKQTAGQSSRRNFFTNSAVILGAAGAVASTLRGQTAAPPNDVALLNYALALENLEAAFYNQGLSQFGAGDFTGASYAPLLGPKISGRAFDSFKAIRDHENAHVNTLNTVIKSLGGVPAAPCQYNFGYKTFDDFVTVAQALENTGVMAYDGAIALIQNPDLRTAAATIATVEARHASLLNLLAGSIPFPSAFDTAKSMNEILQIAGQFITSCDTAQTKVVVAQNVVSTSQAQYILDLGKSTSADGKPLRYFVRVLPGGKTPALLQLPAKSTATVQFVNGPGDYLLEVSVTDSAGGTSRDMVKITYTGQ